MHVVVIGCGRVGSELAGALEQGGHSVAVVDKVARAFRRLPQGFAGTTVVGSLTPAARSGRSTTFCLDSTTR